MKRVLLLGAGHAQLAVLAAMRRQKLPGAKVLLVTAHERQMYSGMVPGLIAGRYTEDQCAIEIAPLVQAVGARLLIDRAVSLNAATNTVVLASGEEAHYDVLSINTGPTQNPDRIPGARDNALFVRPIEGFIEMWREVPALAEERPLAVVVVGNGAAGVEIVLAVRAALGARASLTLVSDGELLPAYPAGVRKRALAALHRANVQLLPGRCTGVERWHVRIDQKMRVACDIPIIAVGSDAPAWLAGSGLALDASGFVRVGPTLQSASHANVFAAGDVIVRDDAPHPRSGVYAVRAGPTLAANLRAFVAGGTLVRYVPQRRSLNLLATGDGRAIANWGRWSAQGRLMGWWKNHIDRRFVARHQHR